MSTQQKKFRTPLWWGLLCAAGVIGYGLYVHAHHPQAQITVGQLDTTRSVQVAFGYGMGGGVGGSDLSGAVDSGLSGGGWGGGWGGISDGGNGAGNQGSGGDGGGDGGASGGGNR